MRAGAQALLLLAAPMNVLILRALAESPMGLAELRSAAESPAQTTLRAQLSRLAGLGLIEKRQRKRFPRALEYEMGPAGRDLLDVDEALERWLASEPRRPIALGSKAAKAAICALVEGWSSTIVRALAARPLSLTELDGLIASLNYPSLERRIAAMRHAGLLEARRGDGRGTPYAVTEWLRRGIGPLLAATRWERRRLPQATAPPMRIDAEAAFLLTVPLLRLPAGASGSCRLTVDGRKDEQRELAGVLVEVANGRVISCTTRLEGDPDAWASGSSSAWLAAVTEADDSGLEAGGDSNLARTLTDAMNRSMYREARPYRAARDAAS